MTRAMAEAKCADMRAAVFYRHGRRDAVQNRLLFHIKNQRSDAVPRFLAAALASSVEELLAEYDLSVSDCMLTYLPRSHAARLEYGTDQAEAIAKALSRQMGIGFARLILRNRLHNRSQKELSPTARMKNAKAAFRLHPKADVKGKYLFLVDDIITTGAGMAVGTRLLRRAGAKAVFCLAVARDDGIPDWDLVPKQSRFADHSTKNGSFLKKSQKKD
jgi:ComF family protein